MKQFLTVVVAVIIGVILWRIGERMSSDAIGLAVGVVFGVLAGLPAAILVLAGGRRRSEVNEQKQHQQYPQYGYGQPPVIVLAGGQPAQAALPDQQNPAGKDWQVTRTQERDFRWVGVPQDAGED